MAFFTQATFIEPILTLIAWTFVMWVWMYVTRLPAMQKAKIDLTEAARTGKVDLPHEVRRIADNYNHLHEQPTIFYALALAMELMGAHHPLNIALAWAYVVIRIIHSLIQALVNYIPARFATFVAGSLVLAAMLVHAIIAAAIPLDV